MLGKLYPTLNQKRLKKQIRRQIEGGRFYTSCLIKLLLDAGMFGYIINFLMVREMFFADPWLALFVARLS